MPVFEIESHTVSTCVERLEGDEVQTTRLLDLVGPVLEDSVQHRALLTFADGAVPGVRSPVGYLSDSGSNGLTIIGWLEADRLRPMLALLDRGPVLLRYRLVYGSVGAGYLDRLRLEEAATPDGPGGAGSDEAGPRWAGTRRRLPRRPGRRRGSRRPFVERSVRCATGMSSAG